MGGPGKRVEIELPCVLTRLEMESRHASLVHTVGHKIDVMNQKKVAMKEFNDKLTAIEERQVELSHVINTGVETRMVACWVQFHTPVDGMKRVIRLDSGEIVSELKMSEAEC